MRRSITGVTLIELTCVMVCLSILVGLTAASWFLYRLKIQRALALTQVKNTIAFARAQAVSSQRSVFYCGSSNGKRCDGHWDRGQIVGYVNSQQILHFYPAVTHVQLSFHANFGRNEKILFLNTGFTQGQNGRFDFCIKSLFSMKPCESLILHFSGQTVER